MRRSVRVRVTLRSLLVLCACIGTACADNLVELPSQASQGQLVQGRAPIGTRITLGTRSVRVSPAGVFVVGVGRDQAKDLRLSLIFPDGGTQHADIRVLRRDWPTERVDGVPEKTVNPPPDIAARIAREQAAVAAARDRDDARADFADGFVWPLTGRISGRFGRQRVYNGTPQSPHSGTDVAAPQGTLLRAPAAGIVTFAEPSLYLTGGTVLLDHGHGVSSAFLHLSRIDVKVGANVERGTVLGAVGATGRATGPHMHWGLNWFDVRLDPELVAPPMR
jgi:murein DD-endopeptidase MepM/ murein hydrolase activator NlpD